MKDFLERILKDEPDHKVFMICDNLKVHHSKPIKAWLEEQKERISLFYLPSYAPEYNPDEYLNSDLKNSVASKPQPRNEDEIQTSAKVSYIVLIRLSHFPGIGDHVPMLHLPVFIPVGCGVQ